MNGVKCFFIDKVEMPNIWDLMWNCLVDLEGDCECLNQGEVWQNMGSKIEGSDYFHTFRHRCHPTTKQREYRHIEITFGMRTAAIIG